MASAAAAALMKEALACEQRKDLHEAVAKLEQVGDACPPVDLVQPLGLFLMAAHVMMPCLGSTGQRFVLKT